VRRAHPELAAKIGLLLAGRIPTLYLCDLFITPLGIPMPLAPPNMETAMFNRGQPFKVLWTVVTLGSVAVMNNLVWFQETSKYPLHDDTMFCHPPLTSMGMSRQVEEHIAISVGAALCLQVQPPANLAGAGFRAGYPLAIDRHAPFTEFDLAADSARDLNSGDIVVRHRRPTPFGATPPVVPRYAGASCGVLWEEL